MNTMKWAEEIYETPSEWGEVYCWDEDTMKKNIRLLSVTLGEGWEDIGIRDCNIYSLTSAAPGIEEELGDDEKLYEQYHRGGIRYFVFTHASDQGEYRFLREVYV